MNILIISFFFSPDKKVGALRTSYWFNFFLSNPNFNVEVITNNKDSIGKGVYYVPTSKASGFQKYWPIKDEGLVWKSDVEGFVFKNNIAKPDVVLISGSPFMHFSLSNFFKKQFGSKIILDYRDPFSLNPAFNNSWIKIKIKQFYERRFNKNADGIITVNNYCSKLIQGFFLKPNAIIQNGYDDTFTPELKKEKSINLTFSYAGKFYFDPLPIFKAVLNSNALLTYAGPDKIDCISSERIKYFGFIDYNSAVQMIADSDVGIIQTYGEDFQSTTKIFDYIRCRKAILIVSNKQLNRGSIHEELKTYPNVFWTKNDPDAILETINLIQNSVFLKPEDDFCVKFSRKNQTSKLLKLIDTIYKSNVNN
jgi:hypothetical protein